MQQLGCNAVLRDAAPETLLRLLRKFIRDRSGATAVEFAMIAIPFLGLLFAIFMTAFMLLTQEGLDAATATAARQLMTGQAQGTAGITTADQFRDSLICNPTPPAQRILPSFIDCSKLIVDVNQATNFASTDVSDDFYTNPTTKYNPGGANCVDVVRVVYPLPAFLSILTGNGTAGTTGQKLFNGTMSYMLLSTAVFRNEPFPNSSFSAC